MDTYSPINTLQTEQENQNLNAQDNYRQTLDNQEQSQLVARKDNEILSLKLNPNPYDETFSNKVE